MEFLLFEQRGRRRRTTSPLASFVGQALADHGLAPAFAEGKLANIAVLIAGIALVFGGMLAQQTFRLDDDGTVIHARSMFRNPQRALNDLGRPLGDGDLVQGAPGISLSVARSTDLSITADGKTKTIRGLIGQPRLAAESAGIILGPNDLIVPVVPARRITMPKQFALTSFSTAEEGTTIGAADGARLRVLRGTTINLVENGQVHEIVTTASSVGEALYTAGIELTAADVIVPFSGTPVTPGMRVSIERSRPATIEVDGTVIQARSRAKSVAQLLTQEHITTHEGDRVDPALSAPLTENMVIKVTRIRDRTEEFQESVPAGVDYRDDPTLPLGQTKIEQQGVPGIRKWTTRAILEDGKEVGRQTVRSWIERAPVPTIIRRGTKVEYNTLDAAEVVGEPYWAKVRVYTTAYSAETAGKPKGSPGYGITSTGKRAGRGIVAVDPNYIPYGTRMYIPGYGIGVAADTGGGIVGAWIDVCFDDGEPIIWASGPREIYLLGDAPPVDKIRHLVGP